MEVKKVICKYTGETFSKQNSVDIISAADISQVSFCLNYVKKRKPVVLRSENPVNISDQVLINLIGEKTVEVEDNSVASFGETDAGSRRRIVFKEFLRQLPNGNLYLSTQKIKDDKKTGVPLDFMPEILRVLHDNGIIPLHIPIAGDLILDQVNCWMGYSNEGSSSGFHHDYHDNLYFVLRGKKTFNILSPDFMDCDHSPVRTHGNFRTSTVIQSNGLICYGKDFREDGSPDPKSQNFNEKNSSNPDSFCVNRHAPDNALPVELFPGDIFYLPAGFFHEVISSNDGKRNGHFAVNYWYPPPISESHDGNLYLGNYWRRRYQIIAERAGYIPNSKRITISRNRYLRWRRKPRPFFMFYSRDHMKKKIRTRRFQL